MTKNWWLHREGKRYVFEFGLLCNVVSTALIIIAFSTPYWVETWPRVHSSFKRLGLWEACFAGHALVADPLHRTYHGCWWILTAYFKPMNEWLFPPFFVFVQTMVTICMCAALVELVIMFYIWIVSGCCQRESKGQQKKRDNLKLLQTAAGITVFNAVAMTVVVLVFGIMVYRDIYWLPSRHLIYPSWSYGLAIVSTCFFIFGSITQAKYVQIARREQIQPPKAYEVPMVTDIDQRASNRPLINMNTSVVIPPRAMTSSGGSVTPPLV